MRILYPQLSVQRKKGGQFVPRRRSPPCPSLFLNLVETPTRRSSRRPLARPDAFWRSLHLGCQFPAFPPLSSLPRPFAISTIYCESLWTRHPSRNSSSRQSTLSLARVAVAPSHSIGAGHKDQSHLRAEWSFPSTCCAQPHPPSASRYSSSHPLWSMPGSGRTSRSQDPMSSTRPSVNPLHPPVLQLEIFRADDLSSHSIGTNLLPNQDRSHTLWR